MKNSISVATPTLCVRSCAGAEADWVRLYEESFPAEERASIETLRRDIVAGKRQLHRTLDESGKLLCFSLIYTAFDDFVWLSYIATAPDNRSQGIGSQHLLSLLSQIERELQGRTALVLEIESPETPGLDPSTSIIRRRRLDFYLRHSAKRMPDGKRYVMPNFVPGLPALPAELLWLELSGATKQINLAEITPLIYSKIYGLGPCDPLITEVAGQF
jgi:GNAT superfamily N-acetyltransferase